MSLSRRSLDELYNSGKEFDVSPYGDGSAFVYIRKLGPVQQQTAVRKANAQRATTSVMSSAEASREEYEDLLERASGIPREDMIEQLAQAAVAEERSKVEQELSAEEEWIEDGRLQALVDAWEGGLLADYLKGEGSRSEESERVFEEMKRFTDVVDKTIGGRLREEKQDLSQLSDDELVARMVKAEIEFQASMVWMRTFRMSQILYGVYNTDGERLFRNMEDVETIPAELFAKFSEALESLQIPTTEVKS